MARSPAAVIVDSSGNLVGVEHDGAVYRLQVAAKIDTESPTLLDSYERLDQILLELRKITYLLEHLTDEKANAFDLQGD